MKGRAGLVSVMVLATLASTGWAVVLQPQPFNTVLTMPPDPPGVTSVAVDCPMPVAEEVKRRIHRRPMPPPWTHPVVREWLKDTSSIPPRPQLVIVFPDTIGELPYFPAPATGAEDSIARLRQVESLIGSIRARRAQDYDVKAAALAAQGV